MLSREMLKATNCISCLVRILRTIIQNPRLSEKLGISPIECLDYRLASSLIEGIGDACVQIAAKTIALKGVKMASELQKLLLDLQEVCCRANEQALKSFTDKDISLAENVRNLRTKKSMKYILTLRGSQKILRWT